MRSTTGATGRAARAEPTERGAETAARVVLVAVLAWACGDAPPSEGGDAADRPRWPSYADVPHSVCMGVENTHECALAVERHQLRHAPPGLSREDSVFRIRLADDDTARVVDQGEFGGADTDARLHGYLGHHPGVRQHLFEVTLWEGGHFLLLDPRTGERETLQALPVVSPDSTRFAVASSALEYASRGSLEIWRVDEEQGIERTWAFDLPEPASPGGPGPNWSPGDAFWLSPDSLCVRIDTPATNLDAPGRAQPSGWGVLERRNGGWAFVADPAGVVSEGEGGSTAAGRREQPCSRTPA